MCHQAEPDTDEVFAQVSLIPEANVSCSIKGHVYVFYVTFLLLDKLVLRSFMLFLNSEFCFAAR